MAIALRNKFTKPPEGVYTYDLLGECVSARTYFEFAARVADLHKRKNVPAPDVDRTIAEYLCPRLPDGYCTKPSAIKMVSIQEIKDKAQQYFKKPVLPRDSIEKRLGICANCPCNSRVICLSCTGLDTWIRVNFRNQRDRLPLDAGVGVCTCAETLAAVVASVEYDGADPVWPTTPDNCWRK